MKIEFNVKQEMRDGIKLAADIYRPDAEEQFPVILKRTYNSIISPESGRFHYLLILEDSKKVVEYKYVKTLNT